MAVGTQPVKPAFRERRIERAKDGRIVIIRPAKISDAAEITRRMARVAKKLTKLNANSTMKTLPNRTGHSPGDDRA